MTIQRSKFLASVAVTLAACCTATSSSDSVRDLLENAEATDGQQVQIEGTVGVSHGLINLYSRSGEECVGLLMTDEQRSGYIELEGRTAVVMGTFRAQGCGRDGICDEHLCGPGILTEITSHAES